jgi:class 3 adenylate cyclase/DNA polymerase III delta prime subunit
MAGGGGQIGTRSVLFTDLVGSTELRVRLGEEAADELRRTHDALLSEAVTAHGGGVVKGLGDGIMATFESAADGVAAAVAIQQAVDAHARRLRVEGFAVRVGLSIGDVSTEEGDVFGVPVVEASRLCQAAGGGEVLVAEVVRALARGRGGFTFEPMGELELKGLAEPVPACRVVWEPLLLAGAGGADDDRVPLQGALVGLTTTAYVGRDGLRDRLLADWAAVRDGTPRTVLLAGEPGVGKTRTAAELARTAYAGGALVLFGRCDEGLGVPYQPFVEALEHHVTHAADPALGRLPGELRRLVPDLGVAVPGHLQPVASDPASEEHRLLEACASWLASAAQAAEAGCVLVLDDVHWATKPTLQLLQHVVRSAAAEGAPLLVVATYRDTDVDRSHPLSSAIADLRRLPGVDRIAVDNLTAEEVVTLIATAAGHELDEVLLRLAAVMYAETEGNPFFVGEVLRHLVETGGVRREGDRWVVADPDHVAVPEGVRDVVGRRLDRLSPLANDVLSVAAVVGRDFDLEVVSALTDGTEDAVRSRLVEEVGVDRFRFAHALVRTTLYDELSATRRRRLHRRVADVLEKVRPDDVRALAHHCVEAGPDGGDVSRALRYTLAAAEEALASRAFADAEARFRGALELLEDAEDPRSAFWVAATCGLGESLRDQGDPGYRGVLLDASRRALELDDVDLAVRAVLANTRGFAPIISGVDDERVEVIEEVLARVGDDPTAPRARLVGLLASELTFSGDNPRRLALVDEAIGLARSLGDDRLLGEVIVITGYSAIAPGRAEALVDISQEGIGLADAGGDPTLRVLARIFAAGALTTVGRIREADALAEDLFAIAEAEGSPLVRWAGSANRVRPAITEGRLAEGGARNDETLQRAVAVGQTDGEQWWASVTVGLAWLQGVAGSLADQAEALAAQYPRSPVWRCAWTWLLSEAGRADEARAVIEEHGLRTAELVDDPVPTCALFQLGQAAFLLDDPVLGAHVVEALTPHAHLWTHYFMVLMGPNTWAVGNGHAAAGDLDRAVERYDETLALLAERGMTAHLPRARLQLAQILRRRAAPGDGERAAELLAAARAEAEAVDAPAVVEAIDAELAAG